MSEFLRTSKISSKIEEIIVTAKEEIILISPYLQLSRILLERLIERGGEGIKIRFVFRKEKVHQEQVALLKKVPNIKIFSLENLHAKSYTNEKMAIVTSMNLYDFSERNNREIGISFDKTNDQALYNELCLEIKSIIKVSKLEYPSNEKIVKAETLDKKLSFNKRLLKHLTSTYPNYIFDYYTNCDIIHCPGFGNYFSLFLEPKENYFRIDFRLSGNYKTKEQNFKRLRLNRIRIEKEFPANVVT